MKNVQWKLLLIVAVIALSIFSFYYKGMNLGLDLKGGVHLVLRVQTDDALRLETETTVERLRDTLTRGSIQFSKLEMRDAKTFVAEGITSGCGGGNYCPTSPVNRQQMAVFLLKTFEGSGYTPPDCTTATFADVPCSSPFAPWIYELVARNITAGCGGGNYCPLTNANRGQMATFLVKTFSLQ